MSVTGNQDGSDPGTEKTITVVGFGLRLAALLLDGLLLGFLTMLLILTLGIVFGFLQAYAPDRSMAVDRLSVGITILFSVAYYVTAWAKSGQTIGKSVLGIKVVGADGKPPSGGKALLRYFGYLVSGLVFALGFVWVVFDRKRQGWHDKIAGTYVVFMDAEFSNIDAVNLVPSDPKLGWWWIILWVVLAIGLPLSGVTAILTLGPVVGLMVTGFFANLW